MKSEREEPRPEVLAKMTAHIRTDMLASFKKQKSVVERFAEPTIRTIVVSAEEMVSILSTGAADPCLAFVRPENRQYNVWLWLPGHPRFDLFTYRFNEDGSFSSPGSTLHSSTILGR